MVRVGITHTARVRVRMKGSQVESRVKVTVGVRAKTGKACFFRVTVGVRAETGTAYFFRVTVGVRAEAGTA